MQIRHSTIGCVAEAPDALRARAANSGSARLRQARLWLMAGAVALSPLAWGDNAAPTYSKPTKVYVFGDSYFDSGASLRLSRAAVKAKLKDAALLPSDPASALYWKGRWSNGPTSVELLARHLGVGLVNASVGGAKANADNYYPWLDVRQHTGVLAQLDDQLATAKGRVDPGALYIVGGSANDYFEHMDLARPGPLPELAAQAANNTVYAVTKLAAAGARNFLVMQSYDLAGIPYVIGADQVADAESFASAYNSALLGKLEALRADGRLTIRVFDFGAATRDLVSRAASLGISSATAPCQPTMPKPKPACAHPDAFLYWDEYHPSAHMHRLLEAAMLAIVQQP